MAEPGIEKGKRYPVYQVSLRLNLRTPQGRQFRWFFPSDDSVDLAVLPLLPDQTKYDFQYIPSSLFATAEQIKNLAVDAGDPVVFVGYFYQFPTATD